jgi:hypothetical protein
MSYRIKKLAIGCYTIEGSKLKIRANLSKHVNDGDDGQTSVSLGLCYPSMGPMNDVRECYPGLVAPVRVAVAVMHNLDS